MMIGQTGYSSRRWGSRIHRRASHGSSPKRRPGISPVARRGRRSGRRYTLRSSAEGGRWSPPVPVTVVLTVPGSLPAVPWQSSVVAPERKRCRATAASATIDSLVLVRCELSDDAIDLIAESEDLAVLTIVDPADRDRLGGAIQGHLASSNDDSDVVVGPFDPAAVAEAVATWLERRVRGGVHVEEVTLRTPDGWVLGADLHVPAGAVAATPVPAVVLMHTGRSDRAVFDRLAKLMRVAVSPRWRSTGGAGARAPTSVASSTSRASSSKPSDATSPRRTTTSARSPRSTVAVSEYWGSLMAPAMAQKGRSATHGHGPLRS